MPPKTRTISRCPTDQTLQSGWWVAAVVAVIFVLLSTSLFAQGTLELSDEERAWLSEHPAIRIAPAPNFPPVEFFDNQGTYHGIAAYYAAILESKLGIRFEVEQRSAWAEVVEGTKLREVDVWMEAADTT